MGDRGGGRGGLPCWGMPLRYGGPGSGIAEPRSSVWQRRAVPCRAAPPGF